MRAVQLTGAFDLELVDVADPVPASGEVVIEVAAVSICGSDLNIYRGIINPENSRVRHPTILGHEFAGRIVDLGPDVDPAWAGARVCVEPNLRCGHCAYCRKGLSNICVEYQVIGETCSRPGAFAQRTTARTEQLRRLPDSVGFEEAALVQPFAISYEAVVNRARVHAGSRVLILGAGPIGLSCLMIAKSLGARIAVTDLVGSRLETAASLGADATIDAGAGDIRGKVAQWAGQRGVDVVLEAVGGKQTQSLQDAVNNVRSRGTVVVLGAFPTAMPMDIGQIGDREISVVGSKGHPETFVPVLDAIEEGRLVPRQIITESVGLAQVSEVFHRLDTAPGGMLKVIVDPARPS